MDETVMHFMNKMYEEMQKDHKQMKDILDALEKSVVEIKTQINENSNSIENELENIQEKILEIKYVR